MQPKDFITTYKKHRFSPLDPTVGDIDEADIAHALSLMCRANGHFSRFFSVARHSVNCCLEGEARGLSREACLTLLLHDAAEAYMSDLTRPVKINFPEYVKAEERLQRVIWEKFGLSPTEADLTALSEIDDLMLKLEFARFANETVGTINTAALSTPNFEFISFEQDEREFLLLLNRLCLTK